MTTPDEHDPQRPRRFTDQRGIALQTVIIMVVLLAIAGGIAAVLLGRGNEATEQLESQNVTVSAYAYTNASLCEAAGNTWAKTARAAPDKAVDDAGLLKAGGTYTTADAAVAGANKGYCHPK